MVQQEGSNKTIVAESVRTSQRDDLSRAQENTTNSICCVDVGLSFMGQCLETGSFLSDICVQLVIAVHLNLHRAVLSLYGHHLKQPKLFLCTGSTPAFRHRWRKASSIFTAELFAIDRFREKKAVVFSCIPTGNHIGL